MLLLLSVLASSRVATSLAPLPSTGGGSSLLKTSSSLRATSLSTAGASEATAVVVADVDRDEKGGASRAWWFDRWWPVGFAATTRRDAPVHIEVLGEDVVVWHDGTRFHSALDRCPHRGARLSEGRVDDEGRIECPYHGWAFDGRTGACESLPQCTAAQTINADRSRATVLPTEERAGMIWAWTSKLKGPGEDASFPDIEALRRLSLEDDVFAVEGARSISDYTRVLPMDASMLVENLCDPSHLPFTHHDTISKRSKAGPLDLKLSAPPDLDGFYAAKTFGGRSNFTGGCRFVAPGLVFSSTVQPNGGPRDWNVAYAVPMSRDVCRLYVRVVFEVPKLPQPVRFIFGRVLPRVPTWALDVSNHKILEDDNVFLHHLGRAYSTGDRLHPTDLARRLYTPTTADAAVVAYRSWLDRFTGGRGAPLRSRDDDNSRGGMMTRDRIIERFDAHTTHCESCRTAHATAVTVNSAARTASFLSLLALALVPAAAAPAKNAALLRGACAGLALATYAAHRIAETLVHSLTHGEYPPPRNKRS